MYLFFANAILLIHLGFIVFVVLGGLAVLRWPRVAWMHLPAAVWGFLVELFGLACPLTTLEDHFLHMAGQNGYSTGFVEHYLLAVIYPESLTRETQWVLAVLVVLVNGGIYTFHLHRKHTSKRC